MEKIPEPGEFYRHFKNKMYQVITVASHTETGEKLVVYQALYGDFSVYARPLSMFMGPVDREKYPDARQNDRFERILPGQMRAGQDGSAGQDEDFVKPERRAAEEKTEEKEKAEAEETLSPLLMEFLDAETCEEQLSVLQRMKGRVGRRELESLYMSLDAKPCGGTVEEELDNLKRFLNMQQRFEASRLRRS